MLLARSLLRLSTSFHQRARRQSDDVCESQSGSWGHPEVYIPDPGPAFRGVFPKWSATFSRQAVGFGPPLDGDVGDDGDLRSLLHRLATTTLFYDGGAGGRTSMAFFGIMTDDHRRPGRGVKIFNWLFTLLWGKSALHGSNLLDHSASWGPLCSAA